MRIENSVKNITIGIVTQIVITLLGFISRKVFLDSLGITYLGVNGLLTNVLSLLGLLEAGIGASIVYSLYKPLAEDDKSQVIALMQLYKKAYIILAFIVFLLSMSLYPFLVGMVENGESISNFKIVYLVFVCKNVIAYLYSYKWCIINADQKGYVLAKRNLVFNILTTIAKIVILTTTKSYILFLIVELLIMLIQSILNGLVVDKRYSYIKTKNRYKINEITRKEIVKNIKALFLHNIGSFCVFGTDNLLISKFINVATVGIYSNYTMIIGQLTSILSPIINGISNSVGNLIATEDEEKIYSIFKITYLINFWIYSVCVIFLYNLLNPFISWWLGSEYLLDGFTFVMILVNCYINGLRASIQVFKSKAGIFYQDKYVPLIESIVNLGASIILVKYLGLAGIFWGTTLSTILIVFWNAPRLVYKYVFKKPLSEYFIRYLFYLGLTVTVGLLTTKICNTIHINNQFVSLIVKGIICISIPNLIYIPVFFKKEEFQILINIIKGKFGINTLKLRLKKIQVKNL